MVCLLLLSADYSIYGFIWVHNILNLHCVGTKLSTIKGNSINYEIYIHDNYLGAKLQPITLINAPSQLNWLTVLVLKVSVFLAY